MKQLFKTLSLAPRSIRHKLTAAFALMSVLPMLVCGYLIIYYIFPTVKSIWDVSLIFAIAIFIMLMGFYLAQRIIYPIIKIAAHAKVIAEGKLAEELDIKEEDEIGELSGSLNQLSLRLKENMSELRSYGEKIREINMEINKKVLALSSLLQIGNLITTATDLDEVFNLIVEKLSQLQAGGAAFLMLLEEDSGRLTIRARANIEAEQIYQVKIGQGPLGKVFESAHPLVIDTQKRPTSGDKNLEKVLKTQNIVVLPVTSSGKVVGILGTGNNVKNFIFSDDEIELVGVFAKQVAVAIENDVLARRTEELTIKDELTGLFNESYIRSRLDEEIKRAISYQRPCSFILFEFNNFEKYRHLLGEIVVEKTLKKIARTFKESTTEIDKVARFSDHQFAVILPERNKHQSLGLAENIKKEIERFASSQEKAKDPFTLTLSGGISAAPVDGTSSVELINQALNYIERAKGEGVNKIVV